MEGHIMRRILGIVSILVVALSVPAFARMSTDALQRVDDILEAQVNDGKIAGAVLRITHQGKTVKSIAVGLQDREASIPMQTDSIFRIASQTKALVSAAVMMLQERGALTISDPVGKYLPEYQATNVAVANPDGGFDIVAATRPITIRDLLTHTAGIGYGNGPGAQSWQQAEIQGWYFAHRDEPVQNTVRRIASLPFDAQPGTQFVYGYNTDILGALVEVVSGQALDTFLAENIFAPLGMVDTHFYLPHEKVDRLTTVYGIGQDGRLTRAPNESSMRGQGAYVDGPRASFSGGAGLLSTAADYSRFLEAMRNGGKLGRSRILGRKSVELMTVNHLGDIAFAPGQGFGLGFSTTEDLGASGSMGSIGVYGWGGAYHTTYWVDPVEELVVTYMTQLLPASGADDTQQLRVAIYAALE
jgi:CubicO group peptidase (beta-lactamase class C family)